MEKTFPKIKHICKYNFVKLVIQLFNNELNKLHEIQEKYYVYLEVGKDSRIS